MKKKQIKKESYMKKFMKIAVLVLIAAIFIGTFVFLYQKSQPEVVSYQILKAETKDLVQTTVRYR